MAQNIRQQLEYMFSLPLSKTARRRIVFWHDVTGEFADTFAELSQGDTIELGGVPVTCVSLEDQSVFGLKRTMTREGAGENFLVYTRRAKDDLSGDWLADVELYSDHFQSDATSLVLQEINAIDTPGVRNAVRHFVRFFRAKDRRTRFCRRVEAASSADEVTIGVLSVLLGTKDARPESIVLAYVELLADSLDDGADGENQPNLDELQKYDALPALETLVRRGCGYEGELADAVAFLSQLLLTAASVSLPTQALAGLERFVSSAHATFCLGVVRAWMQSIPNDRLGLRQSSLYTATTHVEEVRGLRGRFSACAPSELEECDVFPCVDTCILQGLTASMAEGADRREEVRQVFDVRKNLCWYPISALYYQCLLCAAEMQDFQRNHSAGFHLAKPKDVWQAYVTDWWRMDSAYRHFHRAYEDSKLDLSDVDVDEATGRLASWADALYTNWFLAGVNSCWVAASEDGWARRGMVDGIPEQLTFYRDYVYLEAAAGRRIVVVISDGMRYEVAQELADGLVARTKGDVSVEAIQGILPSETKYGMAALLPNVSLELAGLDAEVLVDGMGSRSTEERQAILDKTLPGSMAIQYKDLLAMPRAARREWAKGIPVVYVYHNAIDISGHHELGGQGVFKSCDQAIAEVTTLVDVATKDLGASRVLVTADHGFLYTALDLGEADKVSRDVVEGEVLKASSRYVVCSKGATSDVLLPVRRAELDDGRYAWLFARDCVRVKSSGSKNYVHGGVSLQECCVPVVRVTTKGRARSQKASIQLLDATRRITNSFFTLRFFQKEAVGGKVLPAEYELVMVDARGREVTDVRIAQANNPSPDESARRFKLQFALRPGLTFKSKDAYYLVAREKDAGREVWREQFSIDVSFAPLEDFGF